MYILSTVSKSFEGLSDLNWFAKILLLYGALIFAKQAPKFLTEMIGMKDSKGLGGLKIKDKLGEAAFIGAKTKKNMMGAEGALKRGLGESRAGFREARRKFKNEKKNNPMMTPSERKKFKKDMYKQSVGGLARGARRGYGESYFADNTKGMYRKGVKEDPAYSTLSERGSSFVKNTIGKVESHFFEPGMQKAETNNAKRESMKLGLNGKPVGVASLYEDIKYDSAGNEIGRTPAVYAPHFTVGALSGEQVLTEDKFKKLQDSETYKNLTADGKKNIQLTFLEQKQKDVSDFERLVSERIGMSQKLAGAEQARLAATDPAAAAAADREKALITSQLQAADKRIAQIQDRGYKVKDGSGTAALTSFNARDAQKQVGEDIQKVNEGDIPKGDKK